MHQGLKFILLE